MQGKSWLIREGSDRERMLDMNRRITPARKITLIILSLVLVVTGPWFGYWTVLMLVVAGVFFAMADRWAERSDRPEYGMFGAWVGSEVMIAVAAWMTGGPTTPVIFWLAVPIATLPSRFSTRGIIAGVGIALAFLVTVTFGVDAAMASHRLPFVLSAAAVIVTSPVLVAPMMRSDVKHRKDAFIDQLTGLLNRSALATRTAELAHQSAITNESIAVIVGDLDNFKRINDTHGHAAGDMVLQGISDILRRELRAFDLVYRLGGEEFVILLPGADLDKAELLAEKLRTTVASEPVGNHQGVTMSFGVSVSAGGMPFDYASVFDAADTALYRAKGAGRNCVFAVRPDSPPPVGNLTAPAPASLSAIAEGAVTHGLTQLSARRLHARRSPTERTST